MLPKSTASILGIFIVHSGILQMQSLSRWLCGFNLVLLRLHKEIFLSLIFSHSSWCSALVLVPLLHVGCPQESLPHPDRRGLNSGWLSLSCSLRPGIGRGTVVIIGMRCKPEVAEAGMMLEQPKAHHVFFQGNCPWISGPWKWRVAQLPGWCR